MAWPLNNKSNVKHILKVVGKIYVIISTVFMAAFLAGCVEHEEARCDVRRLDLALREGHVPQAPEMRDAAGKLFAISGYGALTDSAVAAYASAPFITLGRQAMDSLWGTAGRETAAFREVEGSLGRMSGKFSEQLPDVELPRIYAVVSPFNQSVFTADSVMFLGLNHYMGTDYEPYAYFPDYIRRRKVAARILPDVAEALVRRDYPYAPGEEYPTVLSRLLYEGAVTEAVMRLTGLDERQTLAYDEDEWAWLEENEAEMWHALAGRKLLFSTDGLAASMLTGLSPVTTILHHESPGYAGRFVGHRIVGSYLKYNDVPLSFLLSRDFYDSPQTLSKARY